MVPAITIFALSALGIIVLFSLKAWEERSSRVIAPSVREKADASAHSVKRLIMQAEVQVKKLPPEMVYLSRTILHDIALGAAKLARFIERQLHRLADRISHKHNFERKETTSAFLKNVSGYKNGGGESGESTLPPNLT